MLCPFKPLPKFLQKIYVIMSVALSFIGGTGLIGFCEMLFLLKKWFPFWLAFSLRHRSPLACSAQYLLRSLAHCISANEIQSQQLHQYDRLAYRLNAGTSVARRGNVCLFQDPRDLTPYSSLWHHSRDPTRSPYYNAQFTITSHKQIIVNK